MLDIKYYKTLSRHIIYMLSLSMLCLLYLSYSYAQESRKINTAKLENDLTLIHTQIEYVPMMRLEVLFDIGAKTETTKTDGLTHLLEHMLLNGNSVIPDDEIFTDRIDTLGGLSNAMTGTTFMNMFATFPSSVVDEMTKLLAASAMSPKLSEKSLEKERIVVLDEFKRFYERNYYESYVVHLHQIYGDQLPAVWPLGASEDPVRKITHTELQKLHKKWIGPSNTTVIMVGNISFPEAKSLTQKYFGMWESPKDWVRPQPAKLPPFPTKSSRWNFAHRKNSGVKISYTLKGPYYNAKNNDVFSGLMLEELISNPSGKFYQKYIQTGKWRSGNAWTYLENYAPKVLLVVNSKKVEDSESAIKEILDEAKLWAQDGYFSPKEFEAVRTQVITRHKREADVLRTFARYLSFFVELSDPQGYLSYKDKVAAVTLSDVQKFVLKYIVDRPYVLRVEYKSEDAAKHKIDLNGNRYFQKNLQATVGTPPAPPADNS